MPIGGRGCRKRPQGAPAWLLALIVTATGTYDATCTLTRWAKCVRAQLRAKVTRHGDPRKATLRRCTGRRRSGPTRPPHVPNCEGANLSEANLIGATWSNTIRPNGTVTSIGCPIQRTCGAGVGGTQPSRGAAWDELWSVPRRPHRAAHSDG